MSQIEIRIYTGADGQLYWRAVNTGNQNILAGGMDGYHNETDIRGTLEALFAGRHRIVKLPKPDHAP